jgi:molecular chaperone GrpE
MMKKKHKEEEGGRQDNETKTTDIKENTGKQEDNSGKETEITDSGEATKPASENVANSDTVAKEVGAVEEKLAEMQDKYIRLSAEFDNYRKRTLREKIELTKYAGENLLLKIIPVMDDFDRALKHMDTSTDSAAMKNGIDLIYGKFSEFLKQNGIKEIESLNSNFNVDLHEAVAKVPVGEEEKKGKVIDVVLKGYYLEDKVLRFSKVIIGE